MKKISTFLFAAAVSATAWGINPVTVLPAHGWNTVFTDPFKAASQSESMNVGLITRSNDGSIYLASLINEEKEGKLGNTIEAIAGGSVYLAKHNAQGELLWDTSIFGAATPTAITTDAQGNLYVAATFAEAVRFDGVDGAQEMLAGIEGGTKQVTSFIAKFDSDGAFITAKAFIPATHPELVGNDMYWGSEGDVYFKINSLIVSNNQLVFAAEYTGQTAVDTQNLKGSYFNAYGFLPGDVPASAVMSLTSELQEATSIFQAQGVCGEGINYPATGCQLAQAAGNLYVNLHVTGKTHLSYQNQATESIDLEINSVSMDGDTYYSDMEVGYLTLAFDENGLELGRSFSTVKGIDPYSLNNQASAGIAVNEEALFVAAKFKGQHPFTDKESKTVAIAIQELNKADLSAKATFDLHSTQDITSVHMAADKSYFVAYASADDLLVNNENLSLGTSETALVVKDGAKLGYHIHASGVGVTSLTMHENEVVYCGNLPFVNDAVQKELAKVAFTAGDETSLGDVSLGTRVQVYPNPATEQLFFSETVNGAIYALDGRVMVSLEDASQADVRMLNPGTYVLKGVTSLGDVVTQKIVKR